jgi:OOP family OmpA-OmpF porin
MSNYRFAALSLALAALGATGCATKNYVRSQTAPLIEHTDQLDAKTAANNQKIHEVDDRAQAGIRQAQSAADAAGQNAQSATTAAGTAQSAAVDAVHRADSLDAVVKDLDNYKPVSNVTVNFGFDKAVLTAEDRASLDTFAAQLGSARATSSKSPAVPTPPAPRNTTTTSASAAPTPSSSTWPPNTVAAHRFYLIGIGKDKEVAPNTTADGRRQNRRVDVQLLTNISAPNNQTASSR